MATLDEAINFDRSGFKRIEAPAGQERFVADDLMPRYNPLLRSPLPPNAGDPDAQRNFYQQGKIPQFRIAKPASQAPTGNISTTVNLAAGGSTSVAGATNVSPQDTKAGYTTQPLDVGAQEQGVIVMAKTVTIKQISVDNPARVRLYSTAALQGIDATRGDDVTALNGTQHGVIMDIWMDDLSLSNVWTLSPAAVGGNGDDPDQNIIYITVDNIGSAFTPITVSIDYVGEES
jgi:hypothetical protein